MKFSICRSLSFSFTARLCRQPDHTEIKNTKCFFLSFTTSIHSPSTIYSAPFFNFHIFILIFRDTLCHCSSPCTTSPLLSPYSLSANIIHFLSLHLNNSPLHNLPFLKDTKVRSFPTRTVGFVSYLVLAHWCLLLLTFASVLDYI